MHISANAVLRDYKALREAASAGNKSAVSEMTGQALQLRSAQIDNDPSTTDTIVVSSPGNGAFSGPGSAPALLRFTERQQEGKQVLEFAAEQAASSLGGDIERSSALIDLSGGFLLSTSGQGTFLVSKEVVTAAPTPDAKQERENVEIRAAYQELKGLATDKKVGEEFFLERSERNVTLEKSEPGLIQISYWGGAFSGPGSGTLTETYREFQQDGKAMLSVTRVDPGDFMGIGASETQNTLAL